MRVTRPQWWPVISRQPANNLSTSRLVERVEELHQHVEDVLGRVTIDHRGGNQMQNVKLVGEATRPRLTRKDWSRLVLPSPASDIAQTESWLSSSALFLQAGAEQDADVLFENEVVEVVS